MSVSEDFATRSIASLENLLVIAKRERAVTCVMSIVMLGLIAIAAQVDATAAIGTGLGLGWCVSRHFRARRFIHSTTGVIARLRGTVEST